MWSRRRFSARLTAGAALAPGFLKGGVSANEKLNIAGVGIGAMGANYLRSCESENIAALCDVDEEYAAKTFARYPQARRYLDFRKMLEKEKSIDAVIIGTPDHTHAVIALAAIGLGKHVYCAKPLARTLQETRAIVKAAREARVATQMSVQSCATEPACATEEWIQSGAIGAVREVHVWSDRPIWPQGLERPEERPSVPPTLDWDLWLGPAPHRPYHSAYHPFVWRGWYDFGTGALGDMACHTFHMIFRALKLGSAAAVQATTPFTVRKMFDPNDPQAAFRGRIVKYPETFPDASIVTWDFPARGPLPPVRLTWYDGGLKPPRPVEMTTPLERSGVLFMGSDGVLLSGFSGGPRLVPESRMKAYTPPPKTVARTAGHYREWIEAAKGGKPANCNFEFGGLLAETALLGTIAQRTGRHLNWDAENLRITNDEEANQLVRQPNRRGWEI